MTTRDIRRADDAPQHSSPIAGRLPRGRRAWRADGLDANVLKKRAIVRADMILRDISAGLASHGVTAAASLLLRIHAIGLHVKLSARQKCRYPCHSTRTRDTARYAMPFSF